MWFMSGIYPLERLAPFALECKVVVDRVTGKFDIHKGAYRCYAAGPERFPGVREHRWRNFDFVKGGGVPILPKNCKAVRIHAAGDFFNQEYFDMWLDLARVHPGVEFWAFTKSLRYWVKRLGSIPGNLVLTASYGGRSDELIEEYGLKHCKVYGSREEVPEGMPIDINDDWARTPGVNFALLDNFKVSKKQGLNEIRK